MIKINGKVSFYGHCPLCHKLAYRVAVCDTEKGAESYDDRIYVCFDCALKMAEKARIYKKISGGRL